MSIFESIILGIIEGLTEFLPISSTGHIIIMSHILALPQTEFVKSFEIAIQLGAIAAMIFFYFHQITNWKLYPKIITAFVPTALVGFTAYSFIKNYLFESPSIIAFMLIAGGIVLIFLNEKIETTKSSVLELENISYKNAFFIGCFQCLAMIPGVSRSAATIVGGVFSGFNKKMATEFSFLLAIPTMMSATGYDLLKTSMSFSENQWHVLGVGFIVAFLIAFFSIRTFLQWVKQIPFSWFGYYRIVLGIIFLILFW